MNFTKLFPLELSWINDTRFNLKLGYEKIVPRLLKKFLKQVTGKIVARWDAEDKNKNVFSVQICSKF